MRKTPWNRYARPRARRAVRVRCTRRLTDRLQHHPSRQREPVARVHRGAGRADPGEGRDADRRAVHAGKLVDGDPAPPGDRAAARLRRHGRCARRARRTPSRLGRAIRALGLCRAHARQLRAAWPAIDLRAEGASDPAVERAHARRLRRACPSGRAPRRRPERGVCARLVERRLHRDGPRAPAGARPRDHCRALQGGDRVLSRLQRCRSGRNRIGRRCRC